MKDEFWFIDNVETIKEKINILNSQQGPVVSVIVPAYNEEKNILRTIASLSETLTTKRVEIMVVDNNSKDKTKEYIMKTGAKYYFEPEPGVDKARNRGLANASGTYVLNADADTIYSPYWVDLMINPLIKDESIACTHGKFSFIPDAGHSRAKLYMYELIGDIFKKINGAMKDKAMYVYGCSSGYRREQGLAVDGYSHPPGYNEDGYLGLKLRKEYGRLKQITKGKSLAWTSNRKFVDDKTLLSRMFIKLKYFLKG
ncbi:MAG: glycosyltransferase family 2 protein [Niabella sp.]